MITDEEIEARLIRIGHARARRHLFTLMLEKRLKNEHVEDLLSTGFWRSAGFPRLFNYLRLELMLDEKRAEDILITAIRSGHEDPALYGITAEQLAGKA